MEELLQTLRQKMKDNGVLYSQVCEESRERGMNEGKGFSYSYVRSVLIYGDRKNMDLVTLATEMVTARARERAELQAALEAA